MKPHRALHLFVDCRKQLCKANQFSLSPTSCILYNAIIILLDLRDGYLHKEMVKEALSKHF